MSESVNLLAAWVLTYALHSTLLLAAALLVMRRVHAAATRDLLCKVAAFAALITASAQTLIPRQTDLQPLAGRWELQVAQVPTQTIRNSEPTAPAAASVPVFEEPATTPIGTSPQTLLRERWQSRLPSWPQVVLVAWLLSALLGSWLLGVRYLRVRRRFAQRVVSADAVLCAQLDDLRRASGIARPIVLSVSDEVLSPVALGRSEVCLPSGLLGKLSRAQRGTMLAHELAHLNRRDPHWLFAFGWLEALFAFQPLNRIARKEFQRAAEQLCDEFALAQTQQPLALAQCLAEVATWLRGEKDVFPYPAMAESASPLLKRVERVLNGVREPLTVSRRFRWAAAGAVALFVCIAPAVTGAVRIPTVPIAAAKQSKTTALQPDIAAAVRAIGNGVVRFSFPARPSICGTGEEKDGTRMFALLPSREWLPARKPDMLALYVWADGKLMRNDVGTNGKWTTACLAGPARIDLQIENGRVARIDPSVADPAPKVRGVFQDLGDVQVSEATRYLVQLSREGDQLIADRALLSAMLARAGLTSATLRELAVAAPNARASAERWIAALESGLAADAPVQQLAQSAELRVVANLNVRFAERQAALARAARNGLQPAQLMMVYAKVPDRAMRVELIDWLAARENEAVREFLKDIVRKAVVLEEQQAALRALANSSDANARNWAAEFKRGKHERLDEVVGAPQSALAQRVAKVNDGLVHITYEVRPEVCGSGVDDDGAGMFALMPTDKWKPASSDDMAAFYSFDPDDFSRLALSPNPSWTDKCVRGPGHLLVDVRRGQVASLQIAVGLPVRVQFDHDLGRVSGAEAASYLIELATRADKAIAVNAILAAVMSAGQPTLYRDLVRIAADASRPESVRGTALHWAALDQTPGAAQLIRENAANLPQARDRTPEGVPYRRGAIGESSAYLVPPEEFAAKSAVAIAIDDRQPLETRKKMIVWLHEHEPRLIAPLYEHIPSRK